MNVARVFGAEPGEERKLVWSFLCFFFLLCGYYLLRPIRDAMGVEKGIDKLPWVFTATFASICVLVPLYSMLAARYPRQRILAFVYRFFALNLLLFGVGLIAGLGKSLGHVFFVWTSVYNLFVLSIFWSFMADVWDGKQARRLFPVIAAGGSVGAIIGPTITNALVVQIGRVPLVLVAVVLLEASVQCAARLRGPDKPPIGGNPLSGIVHVFRSPMLFGIAAQVFCFALTSTVLYFQQASYVTAAATDVDVRAALFARIDQIINTATLVLQLFLVGRFVRWAGLTAALAVLPVVTAGAFVFLGIVPTIGVLVAAQAIRRALHFAIDRPARETLFTLMPPADKYKSKIFIDTFVYRGADAIGGWTYAGLAAVAGSLAGTSLLAVPIALVWLAVALGVGRRAEKGIRNEPKP